MFDLVMFDLDGTLLDSAPAVAAAVNAALTELGLPSIDPSRVPGWMGYGTAALLSEVGAALPGPDNGPDLVMRLLPMYRQKAPSFSHHSRLYPHAREMLQRLRAEGRQLALVTNRERALTESLLGVHHLQNAFDDIVCGDTLPARKPDPAPILHCLRHRSVAPSRALFVGDSGIDAETARRAGVAFWLLPHGYRRGRSLAEIDADRVVDDLDQLTKLLSRSAGSVGAASSSPCFSPG